MKRLLLCGLTSLIIATNLQSHNTLIAIDQLMTQNRSLRPLDLATASIAPALIAAVSSGTLATTFNRFAKSKDNKFNTNIVCANTWALAAAGTSAYGLYNWKYNPDAQIRAQCGYIALGSGFLASIGGIYSLKEILHRINARRPSAAVGDTQHLLPKDLIGADSGPCTRPALPDIDIDSEIAFINQCPTPEAKQRAWSGISSAFLKFIQKNHPNCKSIETLNPHMDDLLKQYDRLTEDQKMGIKTIMINTFNTEQQLLRGVFQPQPRKIPQPKEFGRSSQRPNPWDRRSQSAVSGPTTSASTTESRSTAGSSNASTSQQITPSTKKSELHKTVYRCAEKICRDCKSGPNFSLETEIQQGLAQESPEVRELVQNLLTKAGCIAKLCSEGPDANADAHLALAAYVLKPKNTNSGEREETFIPQASTPHAAAHVPIPSPAQTDAQPQAIDLDVSILRKIAYTCAKQICKNGKSGPSFSFQSEDVQQRLAGIKPHIRELVAELLNKADCITALCSNDEYANDLACYKLDAYVLQHDYAELNQRAPHAASSSNSSPSRDQDDAERADLLEAIRRRGLNSTDAPSDVPHEDAQMTLLEQAMQDDESEVAGTNVWGDALHGDPSASIINFATVTTTADSTTDARVALTALAPVVTTAKSLPKTTEHHATPSTSSATAQKRTAALRSHKQAPRKKQPRNGIVEVTGEHIVMREKNRITSYPIKYFFSNIYKTLDNKNLWIHRAYKQTFNDHAQAFIQEDKKQANERKEEERLETQQHRPRSSSSRAVLPAPSMPPISLAAAERVRSFATPTATSSSSQASTATHKLSTPVIFDMPNSSTDPVIIARL